MQLACSNALAQETNKLVAGLRNAEINYYISFYNSFGTQATFISGFAYLVRGMFKQCTFEPDTNL